MIRKNILKMIYIIKIYNNKNINNNFILFDVYLDRFANNTTYI